MNVDDFIATSVASDPWLDGNEFILYGPSVRALGVWEWRSIAAERIPRADEWHSPTFERMREYPGGMTVRSYRHRFEYLSIHGPDFHTPRGVRYGESSRADVVVAYGPPDQIRESESGTELVLWDLFHQ